MKVTDAEVKKIHEELIVIDGAAPTLSWGFDTTGKATDASGKAFDYYIQGGVTAAPASISSLRLDIEIVQKAVAFFDNIIKKRGFVKIRNAADVERAKREKKFGTWYHMQSSNVIKRRNWQVSEIALHSGYNLNRYPSF